MKCTSGKKQFHCRNDAVKENCILGRQTGVYHNIYQCDICNDWHLTSRTKNGEIKKKKFYIKKRREDLNNMIKQMFLVAAIMLLSSCDTFFAPITFKVIGSGTFNVALSENGTVNTSNMKATDFKVNNTGTLILSAQSNEGTGVKIEAYIGSEKIKSASASGYGVASIVIEN